MANKTAPEILYQVLKNGSTYGEEGTPPVIAARQLYEATMLILDTTMKPSAEREELARRYSAFYGITETEQEANNGY